MHYELIWTRCGNGIDIQKGGSSLSNSGFKVYSCSKEIIDENVVDIPLLYHMSSIKATFREPHFMDDAYFYFTPDCGKNILMNFHPIPFDPEADGEYSHRGGNFINQVFVGDYYDLYPYESFGASKVWDAKKRGEAYYYEVKSSFLPARDINIDFDGVIGVEELAEFVSGERRHLLVQAVAFLIDQYMQPAEDRKFLVIKERNSHQIELWIAAIESAFSPRMASGISFATRLDRFVTNNVYTINQTGQYQTQKNLNDNNQRRRFHAMIIGADERDKANFDNARAMQNASFAVLDGIKMSFSETVDCSNDYYQVITKYDEIHTYFCREFLQMINVTEPSESILELYNAFKLIQTYETNGNIQEYAIGIDILGRYPLKPSSCLTQLYHRIKSQYQEMLKKDARNTLSILNWLNKTAQLLNDYESIPKFQHIMQYVFVTLSYTEPDNPSITVLWNALKDSPRNRDAAREIISYSTAQKYQLYISKYSRFDWVSFMAVFSECLRLVLSSADDETWLIISDCLHKMYLEGDEKHALDILSTLNSISRDKVYVTLLNTASRTKDANYARFLVTLLIHTFPEFISSNNNLSKLFTSLWNRRLENYFSIALCETASKMVRPSEIYGFLKWICSEPQFEQIKLGEVFSILDKKVHIDDNGQASIAAYIQAYKPHETKCINSAHLYAIDLFRGKIKTKQPRELLKGLVEQGFPSVENDRYSKHLIDSIQSSDMSAGTFKLLICATENSDYYRNLLVHSLLHNYDFNDSGFLIVLIETAAKKNSSLYFDSLVSNLIKMKKADKLMVAIKADLDTQEGKQFFSSIIKAVKQDSDNNRSFFRRLFSK